MPQRWLLVWPLVEGSSGGLGHHLPVKGNDWDTWAAMNGEEPPFRSWGWAVANKGTWAGHQ